MYFRKCLNLNDYKFKISRHSYRSTHMNPVVTTNDKLTTDTQKLSRTKLKHNTKENQQITKQEIKRRKNELRVTKKQNKTPLKKKQQNDSAINACYQ